MQWIDEIIGDGYHIRYVAIKIGKYAYVNITNDIIGNVEKWFGYGMIKDNIDFTTSIKAFL